MSLAAVPLALLIDAAAGEPPWLWRRVGHPVTWFGKAIGAADTRFNRGPRRRLAGAAALAGVLTLFVVPAAALSALLAATPAPLGLIVEAVLGSTLIAHKSLHDHVRAVADAPTLATARQAVAQIVGRDVDALDEAGVARAGLETLSESLCDGVVAPALWFALLGLPGLVAYKIVNTADSMIGHRTPRHGAFGAAAARLDDALCFVPARLCACLTVAASPKTAWRFKAIVRGGKAHVSPNAGWPEAAFAAALGLSLGGPRRYGSRVVDGAWLNPGGRAPVWADLRRGLTLSTRIGAIHLALYGALALLVAMA